MNRRRFQNICIDRWDGDVLPEECLIMISRNYQEERAFFINAMDTIMRIHYGDTSFNNINQETVFEQQLEEICRFNPGICDAGLTRMCSLYTQQDILSNPNLMKWCGCFLPLREYRKYVETFRLPVECSPTCSNSNAIKMGDNGRVIKCDRNVCIMNDININLDRTYVGNTLFNQTCTSCTAAGRCECLMDNISIEAVKSRIGEITFSQNCGSETCFDENGNQITCIEEVEETNLTFDLGLLIFFIIIGLILVLTIGMVFSIKQNEKKEIQNIQEE